METNQLPTIQKESIPLLNFSKQDVLEKDFDTKTRINDLKTALILGNLYHHKVRIIFSDYESKLAVETTVWALTEKYVILKGNTYLPISSVYKVLF